MDTWATSSLTPQIGGGWSVDEDLFARVYPMDLRPQAHEIIRTWLFYTVLRSQVLEDVLPWRHAAISGWIIDPDRKKMSKSIGNVLTPADLLREYGADAVRYWAASARLGVDTTFDLAQLKIGRRLAIKILNATRFVLGFESPGAGDDAVTEPLDLAMLDRLGAVITRCTTAFEDYEHASALEFAEQFFWQFCDDYLELVKPRAYGHRPGRRRIGGHGPALRAVGAAQAARPGAAVRLRGGLVLVARGVNPPRVVAVGRMRAWSPKHRVTPRRRDQTPSSWLRNGLMALDSTPRRWRSGPFARPSRRRGCRRRRRSRG